MKYMVAGANRETGENIELLIDATDAREAEHAANRNGVMVRRVSAAPSPASASSVEQGHVVGAPLVNVAIPRRGSSLGVASVIMGTLAFLICWIPLLNLVGLPLSAIGLILGVVGIAVAVSRRGSGIGLPIAGSAICALAIAVTLVWTSMVVSGARGIGNAVERAAASAEHQLASRSVPHTTEDPHFAGTPIAVGDISVEVTSVRVGKVPMQDRGRPAGESSEDRLMVTVLVKNTSESSKIDYSSWNYDSKGGVKDNFQNVYASAESPMFATRKPAGNVIKQTLYPGESVSDVLVFERPVDGVEFLDVQLSAVHVGGRGVLKIRCPASMIER